MWLANGDVSVPIPAGLSGILIALIFAITAVAVALLRRRRGDPATRAVQAGIDAATQALSEALARAAAKIKELELELRGKDEELDRYYQTHGELPPRPPRPLP